MDVRGRLSHHRDGVLAAGLAVLYAVEVLSSGEVAHHRGSAALVAVVFAAALAVRRTLPVLLLPAAAVVIQLNHTVLPGLAEGGSFLVILLIAIFSVGSYTGGPLRTAAAALVLGLIPLAALDPRQPPGLSDWIFFTAFLGAPFVAGVAFRRRRGRDDELAERARAAEVAADRLAAEAVAAERVRIARELHDVVAHAVSVVVVQARAGRRTLAGREALATGAFDAIEQAGEQALVEMRRLLALLRDRDEDGADSREPQGGLGRLEALTRELGASGLPVEVRHEGEPAPLPPGVDLSAYRIVQEALTNTLKHAGTARALVVVRHLPGALEVEISDDGDGSGTGGGSGHGLAGIRERVEVYGGQLDAGRRAEGGFAVRARLPLETTP